MLRRYTYFDQAVAALALAPTGVDAVLATTVAAAGLEAGLLTGKWINQLDPGILDVFDSGKAGGFPSRCS